MAIGQCGERNLVGAPFSDEDEEDEEVEEEEDNADEPPVVREPDEDE